MAAFALSFVARILTERFEMDAKTCGRKLHESCSERIDRRAKTRSEGTGDIESTIATKMVEAVVDSTHRNDTFTR